MDAWRKMPAIPTTMDIASIPCMALRLFQELYYIAHQQNLGSILERGILSHALVAQAGLGHVDISLPGAQQWRARTEPVFGCSIHSYVPLYFNPRNPMLYSRREQQNDLVVLCVSPRVFESESHILFTDGNAACKNTQFSTSMDVIQAAMPVLEAQYWSNFLEGRRMRCAETLVRHRVAPHFIDKVVCNSFSLALRLQKQHGLATAVDKTFFF